MSEKAVSAAPGFASRETTVYASRKPATVPHSQCVSFLILSCVASSENRERACLPEGIQADFHHGTIAFKFTGKIGEST
jgi:hypothetical protein